VLQISKRIVSLSHQTQTKKAMKKPVLAQETALAVQIIDEKFVSPVFTLAEASNFTKAIRDSIIEDGGENISGALVYHPIKGLVAWVSPNGRVWHADNADAIHAGNLVEFTKRELSQNFNIVFA
jgi:hypothetical protein